jgi:kynurenine formamidase
MKVFINHTGTHVHAHTHNIREGSGVSMKPLLS